jgi:hypothetical protein
MTEIHHESKRHDRIETYSAFSCKPNRGSSRAPTGGLAASCVDVLAVLRTAADDIGMPVVGHRFGAARGTGREVDVDEYDWNSNGEEKGQGRPHPTPVRSSPGTE